MGWKLAIHLSESPEEVEFVREGTGGLADIFGSNEWGGVGLSPVSYAQRHGASRPPDDSGAPGDRRLRGGYRDPGADRCRGGALSPIQRLSRVRRLARAAL